MVYDDRILFTDILFLPKQNIVRYFSLVQILSSVIRLPHFVILTFYHPHFSTRILLSAFYHSHFVIHILSSAFYHQPSAIRRHPVRTLQNPYIKIKE